MAFYTDQFLAKRRQWWLKTIDKVQVFVGSTWYTGAIQKKALEGDTIIIHAAFDDLAAQACTITTLRVLDIDGEVAALRSESIIKAAGQGVLIKLVLPISEKEA